MALLWALDFAVFATHATADSTVTVSGTCTLTMAVAYADGTAEPGCAAGTASGTTTIVIGASAAKYSVASPLMITQNTIIKGAGASSTDIDGGGVTQVLNVAVGVQAAISGVTISGGAATYPTNGGGIENDGTLTLENSMVTANKTAASPSNPATDGGGIYNTGQLTVTDSTISGNATGSGSAGYDAGMVGDGGGGLGGGNGGGIYNDLGGTLTITGSTIAGNVTGAGGNGGTGAATYPGGDGGAGGNGGGIYNNGSLTVTASTLSGNATGAGGNGGPGGSGASNGNGGYAGDGGAVFNNALAVAATLTDDTITANTTAAGGTGANPGAPGEGGGIYQYSANPLEVTFTTIASNTATGNAGGLYEYFGVGPIFEANSIVASNVGAPNGASSEANCTDQVNDSITDQGGNIVFGDGSCPGTAGDPKLGPLADNGGPTQTMALLSGSAALNAVPTNACSPAFDERGVARPQGPACDAGAYEFAPPVISGLAASGNSTTTATVSASITPNLSARDTTVTVNYGTTTAYGSSTTATSIPAGTAAVPFSAALSGLTPGSTYHAQIVATNGDGSAQSADITFMTTAALAASIASTSTSGAQLELVIACAGGSASQPCTGQIALTSHVTSRGGMPVAVAAAKAKKKKKKKHKPKPGGTTEDVTVGSGSYSVPSGQSAPVAVSLNAAGTALLSRFYSLPVTVTVSGTTSLTAKAMLSLAVVRSPISFTWAFGPGSTTAQQLTVSKVPMKGHVEVSCSGGGCPFAKRSFAPKGGKVLLAPLFKGGLKPRATLEIVISVPGEVAKVATFTIQSGRQPTLAEACQPPGAKRPSRCAKPA